MSLPIEIVGQGPVVRPLPGDDCDYRLCTSIAELRDYLRPALQDRQPFGADWEATSLNPKLARPAGLGVSTAAKSGLYVPVGHLVAPEVNLPASEVIRVLRDADDAGATSVWFNGGAYDLEIMFQSFRWEPTHWHDVLIDVNLFDSNAKEMGLKASALRFLGEKMYEISDLDAEWVKLSRTQQKQQMYKLPHELDPRVVRVYGCADPDMTLRLYHHPPLRDAYSDQKLIGYLEHQVSYPVREGNRYGTYLDQDRLLALQDDAKQLVAEAEQRVWAALGEPIPLSKKQKVAQKLLDLGVPITERTEKGAPTVATKVLDRYRGEHPAIDALILWAQAEAQERNYIRKLLAAADHFAQQPWAEGRVRFPFKHLGVPTGRMKCGVGGRGRAEAYAQGVADVNVQSIPQHEKAPHLPNIRTAFVAPPDFVTVTIDYSQIEVRIVANLSREPKWIDTYQDPTGDIHVTNAQAIANVREPGVIVTKDDKLRRGHAKTTTFALLYGGDESTIARNAGVTVKEGKAILDAFFVGLPHVKQWTDSLGAQAESMKRVRTFMGRVRHLEEFFPAKTAGLDRKALYRLNLRGKREAINHPVQGGAADIFKTACVLVRREIATRGWGPDVVSPVVLWIHDELVFYCHKDWVTTVVPAVCRAMEFGVKHWPVPLKVDAEIGSRKLYLEAQIAKREKDGEDASDLTALLATVTDDFGRGSSWGETVSYDTWVARYASQSKAA